MSDERVSEIADEENREPGAAGRPLTYRQASSSSRGIVDARQRYEALTDRKLAAHTAAILRERGEFDAANPAHVSLAGREPLAAGDWLEMMAAGEVMARYYRHPAMFDHAAKAGATWEQIGAARGINVEQARRDYRDWADAQHGLWNSYGDGEHRFGLSGAEHAEAMRRVASAEPDGAGWEAGQ